MQLSSFVLRLSLSFLLMFSEIFCNFSLNLVNPFSTGSTACVTVNFTSFTICVTGKQQTLHCKQADKINGFHVDSEAIRGPKET